ncbi:MAG: peptidyl-prolyl cis-trans isomerase [Shimia sp.]|uniref:peptidylprolyl isomerase n=1 Tax=Shimia sp. TaxID=1954381 RepID=UPI003B8B8B86
MSKKTLMPFFKEPLFVFLVLGGLLFAIDAYMASTRKEQIIVDQSTIEYLIERREGLELREISPDESESLIASYVEDEILYREAYKRGLNEGDTRMRRNMILKLRGLIVAELGEPTDDELRSFYQENLTQYTSDEQFQVDHVYFSDASSLSDGIVAQLDRGADFRHVSEKYNRTLGRSSIQGTRRELADYFGVDAARSIIEAASSDWMGPFSSNFGIHFVRKTDVVPPTIAPFDDVAPYLLMDWQSAEARQRIEAEINVVRDNYDIVVTRQ